MIKRFVHLLLVCFATLAVLLGTSTAASASDDWGTTGDFNGWPYTSYGGCYGDLVFHFLGYRLNSSTVTIEWSVNTSGQGHMQIRPYDGINPVAPVRDFAPIYALGNGVFYTHWTSRFSHTWHWGWHPPSGGVCLDELYIP